MNGSVFWAIIFTAHFHGALRLASPQPMKVHTADSQLFMNDRDCEAAIPKILIAENWIYREAGMAEEVQISDMKCIQIKVPRVAYVP